MRGTVGHSSGLSAHTIIGFAHVALGALGVLGVLMTIVFGSGMPAAAVLPGVVLSAVASGALVLAGLWLAEGRKRGAVLAASMDAARCALLAYSGGIFTLDVLLSLVLGGASIWILPQLELPTPRRGV